MEAVVGLVEVSEHQEEREDPLPVTALDPPAVQEGGVSARNKASGLTGHLIAIFLIQGLLVHFCPDK